MIGQYLEFCHFKLWYAWPRLYGNCHTEMSPSTLHSFLLSSLPPSLPSFFTFLFSLFSFHHYFCLFVCLFVFISGHQTQTWNTKGTLFWTVLFCLLLCKPKHLPWKSQQRNNSVCDIVMPAVWTAILRILAWDASHIWWVPNMWWNFLLLNCNWNLIYTERLYNEFWMSMLWDFLQHTTWIFKLLFR